MTSSRCSPNSSAGQLGVSVHLGLSSEISTTTAPKPKYPCLAKVRLSIVIRAQTRCLRCCMFNTCLLALPGCHLERSWASV